MKILQATFCVAALALLAGCNFNFDFKFDLDTREKVPPPTVWNTLDESVVTLTSITQSETLDTTNFSAGNDAGAASIMYFNSPTYEAQAPIVLGTAPTVPNAGDPLDSTQVTEATNQFPQRFQMSARFKVDSGDKSLIGGQDNLGQERYTYTGSRTCQVTFYVDATWDEVEEKLTLIEQVPVSDDEGAAQGDIKCDAGCEEGACPNPAGADYPSLPLSFAQFTATRAVYFMDNEMDLTLVGGQYEDNEVSFRLVIQDLVTGAPPVPNLRPIATQYDITAQFVRP